MKKKALVVHSGGMDSSLCLAVAIKDYGKENILSVSYTYNQRHSGEIDRARLICKDWGIDHVIIDISCLSEITENALTNPKIKIDHEIKKDQAPNTLVMGRNGLMARVAAIHANHLGAHKIYMGVIGVEASNSGYRDCSREYMDKMEDILKMDLADKDFEILTPLVHMTKKETLELGHSLGVLEYLLETTITCYEGKAKEGCQKCPSCQLRNEGILLFASEHPEFVLSYLNKIKN